jgi:hypothetical protein
MVVRKTAALVGDHGRSARGSDDPSDVLADRSRLQKSTGGVWPVASGGDEPLEPTSGLATPGESTEWRKRAGSRVVGGKAETPVAGSHQNRHANHPAQARMFTRLSGALVDGRRSGSTKPSPLTREREKRSSVPRGEPGRTTRPRAGCDRECQRSFTNLTRGRQRRGEVAPAFEREPSAPPHRSGVGREARVVEWTEAGDRAVKRAPPGAGSPKGGLAPQSVGSLGSRAARSVRRKPRARESRDPRVLVS